MTTQPREIRRYIKPDGTRPFQEWLDSLRDRQAQVKIEARLVQVKIEARLVRVELGNLGDYRSVGEEVFELRIDYGPGYRIYFGQIGTTIVLLLCGGDKSTQKQDIAKAKEYWADYERRENSN